MGRLSAEFAREIGADFGVTLRAQLDWHLGYNHYPPAPASMVEPCVKAIEAVMAGNPDLEIELPSGATWRGLRSCSAMSIVEGFHLETWCDDGDYE